MAPSTSVIITRDSPGSAVFQASNSATGHCTAKSTRKVRWVPTVSDATTA